MYGEVQSVTPTEQGEAVIVCVRITNGDHVCTERFRISTEEEFSLGAMGDGVVDFTPGAQLGEEALASLSEAHTRTDAMRRALSLLSFGDNTRAMLTRKLIQRGVAPAVARETAQRAADRGFLKEDAMLERSGERLLSRGYGPRRILAELTAKGFDKEESAAYLETLSAREDFAARCAAAMQKQHPREAASLSDRAAAAKLYAFAQRYGFSGAQIREALRIIGEETKETQRKDCR